MLCKVPVRHRRTQRAWLNRSGTTCACALSHVRLFATLWTIACQTFMSMGFSRQEYWSVLPFPTPRVLCDPLMEPMSHVSPRWQADSLPVCYKGLLTYTFNLIPSLKQVKKMKKEYLEKPLKQIKVWRWDKHATAYWGSLLSFYFKH